MAEQAAKKAVRAQLRQLLRSMEPAAIHRLSVAATDHLVDTPEFARAGALMIFLPLPYEVDAQPIAIRAWQLNKTVTVPLVRPEQRHMIPLEISSLGEAMDTDRIGLRTPSHRRPIPIEMIDMVVVPGLGFDRRGRRLGRGGGFYDRFLSRPEFHGVTCGLGFEGQLIEEVPTAAHDVDLHMLATDRRLLRFDGESAGEPAADAGRLNHAPGREGG